VTQQNEIRPLHVAALTIRDFLGIEEMEISPGKATIIEGKNATGKSSILRALQAAIGGDVPLDPIRMGSEKAEVLVRLSDGWSIRKAIAEAARDSGGKMIEGPVIQKGPRRIVAKAHEWCVREKIEPLFVR